LLSKALAFADEYQSAISFETLENQTIKISFENITQAA